jgi:hypothetical protein
MAFAVQKLARPLDGALHWSLRGKHASMLRPSVENWQRVVRELHDQLHVRGTSGRNVTLRLYSQTS